MQPRKPQYARRFDWDEAKRMYEDGAPIAWIAERWGVTAGAVSRVVKPGEYERQAKYTKRYQGTGICPKCGGPMNKISELRGHSCIKCANRERRTTVRGDELKCVICKKWYPDDRFYRNKTLAHRRFRASVCKSCSNAARAEYRRTHPESERAASRRAYERKRARKKEKRVWGTAEPEPQLDRWNALLRAVRQEERRGNGNRDREGDDHDRAGG